MSAEPMDKKKSTEELLVEILDAVEALHPHHSPHIETQRIDAQGSIYIRVCSCHNGQEVASKKEPSMREAIEALHREVMGKCHEIWKRVDPVVRKSAAVATVAPEGTGAA
jgi:hypothetical protein